MAALYKAFVNRVAGGQIISSGGSYPNSFIILHESNSLCVVVHRKTVKPGQMYRVQPKDVYGDTKCSFSEKT